MRRQLGIRIGLVVVVVALAVWYLYPPAKTINLGLDLQGGIHLVLGVDVDKALEAQVERAGDTAKSELEKRGVGVTRAERRGTSELVIQLGSPQSWDAAGKTLDEVLGTFDRKEADQGAGRLVLALKPREAAHIRDLAVRQGLETIRNRIDQFGVSEPSIQQQGENRILVQLPGVQDPARAKALIGKTALLEFKLVRTADEGAAVWSRLDGVLAGRAQAAPRRTRPRDRGGRSEKQEQGASQASHRMFPPRGGWNRSRFRLHGSCRSPRSRFAALYAQGVCRGCRTCPVR